MQKLGINYTVRTGETPREAFPRFAALGFEAIFSGLCATDALQEEYAAEAARCGLWYESIHAPFGHINDIWIEGEAGDAMLGELLRTVRVCAALSIPIAVVHLSAGNNPPCVCDTGRRRWDALIDEAVRCGVTVAFENQRKLANLAFVFELYDAVPQVKFCWDVGHEKCFAGGREFMPLFGEKLVYTHIHDNLCQQDGDLHRIPFDGAIDFTRTAQLLRGYDGTLTLEILPKKGDIYTGWSWDDYYARAYAAAVKLRDMING